MKIIFIRHGQTATNVAGNVHKRNDEVGLDGTGKEQAHKTAKECKSQNVELIFSSPERRALETATIIGNDLGLEPTKLFELHERDWGDWSDMSWDDIKQQLDKMDLDTRYNFTPPNGESWEEMNDRLAKALEVITSSKHKVVAVVMHGGTLRALMPILKQLPKDNSFKYDFHNASITIFNWENDRFNKIIENSIQHLE